MTVRRVALHEVCDVTDGTHYTPPDSGGPFPFLTVKDMTDDGLSFAECSYIDAAEFEKARRVAACPEAGAVLFSKDGTVGKVHVVGHERPFATLSSIAILRPDARRLDSQFLGFALGDSAILKDAFSRKTGTALQRIILAELKELSIPLPDLPEQRRVADQLEKADRLRRTRRYSLELADTFLPAAFIELFGDPAENPRALDRVAVETLFSPNRNGAKCGPFGSALKKHEYVAAGVPVWTMDNVAANEFVEHGCLYITPQKFEELAAYDAQNGDILISRAGTVGRMAIVQTTHPRSIIHTNMIRLSLNPARVLPIYFVVLMTWFASSVARLKRGQEDAYTFMSTGSLAELQIPLPPLPLQQKFAAVVERAGHLRAVQREALRQAEHLFASLLHGAFSG